MNPERLTLSDRLIFKWFDSAMQTLSDNQRHLNAYDLELYTKLADGFKLVGREMSLTRKQMNHIKQVAAELQEGKYATQD
jgi:transcriptional antiterminator